jgi:chorismate mutase
MTDKLVTGLALDDIRRKIDACDDDLLRALSRRFGLIEHVKALKKVQDKEMGLPLRPAREFAILRRLAEGAVKEGLNPKLLVRLWPLIIAEASMMQAPFTIHVPKKVFGSVSHRLRIRDYYGDVPVEECKDEAQALFQVNANPNDICIVETEGSWAEAFVAGQAGQAQVMSVLPVVQENGAAMPKLLVIAQAPQDATGDDETLVISKGALPRDFSPSPLWQVKSGDYRVSALPGFLSSAEQPFVGLVRSNPTLGLRLAGRYPSPLEI